MARNFLNKLGKKLVIDESSEERERQVVSQNIAEVWDYLRRNLDIGCEYYLKVGDDQYLQNCLKGKVLDNVLSYLDQLRAHNIIWSFPDRDKNAETSIVVEETIGKNIFIITEYFKDHSTLSFYHGETLAGQNNATGDQRILRVTIEATDEQSYFISDVALQSL